MDSTLFSFAASDGVGLRASVPSLLRFAMSGARSDGNTVLQEELTQLVDHGGSAANPTITHAMQRP
jgi:hypothetical protein